MSALGATTDSVVALLKTATILDLVAIGEDADPRVPLLIRGEAGVGKDVLARLIHAASTRRLSSFIKVNCGARPVERCEADLFGHDKGGAPLATRRRLGGFEFAHHGTIYLDRIEAVPRPLVPRLLHVLRTGQVSRIGGQEIIRVDSRVIASTVENPQAGGDDDFRQDLQRLNVIEICIPPLRQRTQEIPLFASYFLEAFNRRYRRNVQFPSDVMTTFRARAWPRNLLELEETVHRLVTGGVMAPAH